MAAQQAAAQSQTAEAAGGNAFLAQADQLGVRQCAGVFAGLGNALTFGSSYTVRAQAQEEDPDAHAAHGLVGMTYADPTYSGQAVGVVMAAPVGQGCEGQMVRVAPFQQSCRDVVDLLPAGSVLSDDLSGVWLYDLPDNEGQAMLVPGPGSCVAVTVIGGATMQ